MHNSLPRLNFAREWDCVSSGDMTRSDETYLESFVEHIATLPAEIRRNLELMKDLDKTNA